MATADDLISKDENLTDDQIIALLVAKYSDSEIKDIAKDSYRRDDSATKEQIEKACANIDALELTDELRESVFRSNPSIIEHYREVQKNPTEKNLEQLNEQIEQSLGQIVLTATGEALIKVGKYTSQEEVREGLAVIDALGTASDTKNSMITSFAGAANSGKFLARTRFIGGRALGLPLTAVMGGIDIHSGLKKIQNDDVGGGLEDVITGTGTLATGAAIYSAVVTAEITAATTIATVGTTTLAGAVAAAAAPIVIVGAIGYLGYHASKDIGTIASGMWEINKIYDEMEERAISSVHSNRRNLGGNITIITMRDHIKEKLIEAGVQTRAGRNGKEYIHGEDLMDAVTDPKIGDEIIDIIRNELKSDLKKLESVKEEEAAWYLPEWAESGEFQLARADAANRREGLKELDKWRNEFIEIREARNAEYAKHLGPFNKLDPELQNLITLSFNHQFQQELIKDYRAFSPKKGQPRMRRDAFICAGQAGTAASPEALKAFTEARDNINAVVEMKMADWKAENPKADEKALKEQTAKLKEQLTEQSLKDPEEFTKSLTILRESIAKKALAEQELIAQKERAAKKPAHITSTSPHATAKSGWEELKDTLSGIFKQAAIALAGMLGIDFNTAAKGDGTKAEPEKDLRLTFSTDNPKTPTAPAAPTVIASTAMAPALPGA